MMTDKISKEITQILKNAADFEVKGKVKEAIVEYERVVKLNPNDGNLNNHLGDLYIKVNRIKEAVDAYMKGIEIFRNDNFYRNALGICKKVLRYDPGNLEINLIIAKLLVELDEKSDASIYLFLYIERQMAAGNKKEVMRAMEYLKELKLGDRKFSDRMAQIYEKVGEPKMAGEVKQETTRILPEAKPREEQLHEIPISSLVVEEKNNIQSDSESKLIIDEISRGGQMLKDNATRFQESVRDIERVIVELRKAIRIDEVITALDKSLVIFSDEQKKSLGLLQKSLSLNLDTLQKSVSIFQQSSDRSSRELETLLKNMDSALINLNKNQTYLSQEINRNLEKVSTSFSTTAHTAVNEVKAMMSVYQKATNDMVCSLGETKDCNTSLLKVSDEIKMGIQTLNNLLTKFITGQETKEKKFNRNIHIIIAIIGVICGLLIVSIIIK